MGWLACVCGSICVLMLGGRLEGFKRARISIQKKKKKDNGSEEKGAIWFRNRFVWMHLSEDGAFGW